MNERKFHKTVKNSFYGLVFAVGALIFAVFAIIFDPGPVLPPFEKGFSSIDCETFDYLYHNVTNQTINLTFYTTEPVEYPIAYLPYFIKTYANNTNYYLEFSREHMHNLSKYGHHLNILIDLPIAGNYDFAFACLNDIFSYLQEQHQVCNF